MIVVVSSLSNRMFTEPIDPSEDKIHSQKDDDWNMKILSSFRTGDLRTSVNFCEIPDNSSSEGCCLQACVVAGGHHGQHNNYSGEVLAYEALHGSAGYCSTYAGHGVRR